MTTNHTLYVKGMHCVACTLLIEDKLKRAPGVASVSVSLSKQEVRLAVDSTESLPELLSRLAPLVTAHGYDLSSEAWFSNKKLNEFIYALPLAAVILVGFIALQKAGLINLITASEVSYSTAWLIGLIASTSSCLAIVGGLVLSLSAATAKAGGRAQSQILFQAGRLVGFFVLGGALGWLGSSFKMSFTAATVLGFIVAAVMVLLGLNLLDIFHFTKKLQLRLPRVFAQGVVKGSNLTGIIGAALIGVLTFFLPCGFTQSMQLYALASGNFFNGAMIMLVFALGTLPVLSLLSFSSFSLNQKPWRGVFYKTAGLVVVALGLINLLHGLAIVGLIQPLINF